MSGTDIRSVTVVVFLSAWIIKHSVMNRDQAFEKMKKVCGNCTEGSINVYVRNLYRLAKLAGKDKIPKTVRWLSSKKLMTKYEKEPLNIRRMLSIAAVKAMKMYGKESSGGWGEYLAKSTEEYEKQRDARQKTKREKERWPDKGYDSLKDVAKKLKKGVSDLLGKKELTSAELYRLQKYVIIALYSEHALRLDWADVRLEKPTKTQEKNFLHKYPRKGWLLTMRKFKTSKSMGEVEIKMSRPTSLVLSMFVPKVKANTTHGFLLTNSSGGKLTRSGLSKILIRLTKKHLGAAIGSQIIRVLKSTKFRKQAETNQKLAQELMHSSKQQLQYSKKD